MSATLKAIKNAATTTIQIGELWRQVRKVRSSDVARVGFAAMAMADDGRGGMDPDAAMARMTPKQMAEITDLQAATVCAGTLAVSSDGEGSVNTETQYDNNREEGNNLGEVIKDVVVKTIIEQTRQGGVLGSFQRKNV